MPNPSSPQRVLIYRLGSLGDTVVALPCFHLIARMYPNAERRLLTNIPVHAKAALSAEVLDGSGLVQSYMNYPIGLRNLRELLALRGDIRKFRPDVLVYLGPPRGLRAARRDTLFFKLCGIPKIVGVPNTDDLQHALWLSTGNAFPTGVLVLNRTPIASPGFVRPETPRPGLPETIGMPLHHLLEPEASRLARCLVSLGDARIADPASWDLLLTAAEKAKAAQVLGPDSSPLIAASIGTKVQAKDWGLDNWRALLTQLAAELPHHRLVLVGAQEESADSAAAAIGWGDRAINLCGQLTPREAAAVLAHATLFLGLDSGPMHLAASVGTPVVAIFAARNRPVHWFPFGEQHRILYHKTDCWGCGLETCIAQQKKCLTSITVEEALAATRKSLANFASA